MSQDRLPKLAAELASVLRDHFPIKGESPPPAAVTHRVFARLLMCLEGIRRLLPEPQSPGTVITSRGARPLARLDAVEKLREAGDAVQRHFGLHRLKRARTAGR
jgi:hypothetical protein